MSRLLRLDTMERQHHGLDDSMDWLTDSPWLAWVGVALLLGAVEAVTVDFVFLMLAGGALAGAGAAALGGGLTAQVISAVVSASILLVVVRPLLKRHFVSGAIEHDIGMGALVGREAAVVETVDESDGRVKLSGDIWSARTAEGAEPIPVGAPVIVIALRGATAIVAPVPGPRAGYGTH